MKGVIVLARVFMRTGVTFRVDRAKVLEFSIHYGNKTIPISKTLTKRIALIVYHNSKMLLFKSTEENCLKVACYSGYEQIGRKLTKT